MRHLPHQTDQRYLVFAATGTDLIFNRDVEVPGFATFALVEDPKAQPAILAQMRDLIDVAQASGLGCIVDTLTWMANRDRAAPLGYDADRLVALNRQAARMMVDLRDQTDAQDVLAALCLGPARDAYAASDPVTVGAARAYHNVQIGSVADAGLDLVHAYTFNLVEEAAGAVLAAGDHGMPVVVSLVVETDGCLASGEALDDAIDRIDDLTDRTAAYFMVNCAHPDHFAHALGANPRLKGIVVNASRASHAELDETEELDDSDPAELGAEVARLVAEYPDLSVIGGCCGTDMRHLRCMAESINK